jgi:di/tricarboxylate transporter
MTTTLLVLLGLSLVLFVTQVVRIEITSIGLIVALALTGILEPAEALSGFSNPATITVVSMLVLSAGLERAGVVDWVSSLLQRRTRGGLTGLLLVIALPTAALSAFVNNTPVVAMMIPVVLSLAKRFGVAPSRLLMPLSFASILGGTCTLFGTSTNILVDALYRQEGGPGLGVFAFTPIGVAYLAVGLIYILLLAPRLLPSRVALSELLSTSAPGHFVTELMLPAESPLAGRTLAEVFSAEGDVKVLELVRAEEALIDPPRDIELRAGDVLFLESTARAIHKLLERDGLEYGTAIADGERVRIQRVDLRIAEAVVTPNSRFDQRRVRSLGLTRRYGVQVLALRRLGRQHQYRLRDLRLRPGDVLLVQGEPASLRALQDEGDLLLVEGVERDLTFPRRAPLVLGILGSVVLLATLGVAPIAVLALAGVGLLLVTRCLDTAAALRAIDPSVLLLLAGTLPLGLAMQKTGLAGDVAAGLISLAGDASPTLLVGALYLDTSGFSGRLSNSATAVLLTPIALALARHMDVAPEPLLIAVAFGGSASFATPIGYQTNTLVMGPGGYRFRDYLVFGLPLNLVLAVVATLLIPIFWPLVGR